MFHYKFGMSLIGFIIFMLPMAINLIYCIFPPVNAPQEPAQVNQMIEIIEKATRILFAVAIMLLISDQKLQVNSIWLWAGVIFLILYHMVWIRYFIGGRDVSLLSKSFLLVPMPLAVFPVLYYIFASVWLHNYVAAGIMVIFGIAHNIVSYQSFIS